MTNRILDEVLQSETGNRRGQKHVRNSELRAQAIRETCLFDRNVLPHEIKFFTEGDFVDVVGTSKGKGFQGVVKRHGFHGVGWKSHGQHDRERAPGSLGNSSDASRVMKGMRMGGRDGGKTVKMRSVKVLKVFPEKNLLVVNGCIPGANGSYVIIKN